MSYESNLLCAADADYLLREVGEEIDLFQHETFQLIEQPEFKPIQEFKPQSKMNFQAVLTNEEYNGPYNFEVDIIPDTVKNPWVYSTCLHKVYMKMQCPFPVDFKVTDRPLKPLFIRITPMYSSAQYSTTCVYSCVNHAYQERDEIRKYHIIRCSNDQTEYVGNRDSNERLCLIIPFSFPQTGTQSVREMFEFVCKNSCPEPGMNRRPIEVIFTLEDDLGNILGRKTLNVRICSCPKRDKEKDEKDNAGNPRPGKKRKIIDKSGKRPMFSESNHESKETVLQIPVVGKHNIKQILKYCQDLYSGEIIRHGNGPEAVPYKEVLSKINAMIRDRTD